MNSAMRFPDCEFDEALWAAYRRHDKVAVTEKLLGRLAAGLTQSRLPVRLLSRPPFSNINRGEGANSRYPERCARRFGMFSLAGNN
jgi:hypothetical protein